MKHCSLLLISSLSQVTIRSKQKKSYNPTTRLSWEPQTTDWWALATFPLGATGREIIGNWNPGTLANNLSTHSGSPSLFLYSGMRALSFDVRLKPTEDDVKCGSIVVTIWPSWSNRVAKHIKTSEVQWIPLWCLLWRTTWQVVQTTNS